MGFKTIMVASLLLCGILWVIDVFLSLPSLTPR
nr:MAG TPA: hypothetical protein [Caudoviricetes sp.]